MGRCRMGVGESRKLHGRTVKGIPYERTTHPSSTKTYFKMISLLSFFKKPNPSKRQRIERTLDTPLFRYPGTKDAFTLADGVTGVQVLGATGSGKSSAVCKLIMRAYLKAGLGFLGLCAKADELRFWQHMIETTGRSEDQVVFAPGSSLSFNFLAYEMHRNGPWTGDTTSVVDLLMRIYEVITNFRSGNAGTTDERFWENGMRRLCRNAIDLLRIARQPLTFDNIHRVLQDLLTEENVTFYQELWGALGNEEAPEEQQRTAFQALLELQRENFILFCINAKNQRKDCSPKEQSLADNVERYFLKIAPKVPEKTSAIFTESLLGIIEPFISDGILKEHFTEGISEALRPERTYQNGTIIITAFPVKEYGLPGVIAQVIMKLQWQLAMERRVIESEDDPRPAVLWVDENQIFLNPQYDSVFQSTSRSSLACTVYISQNLNAYYAAMNGQNVQARTKSLLGNLTTKIFCANDDVDTNEFAAKIIGKQFTNIEGYSAKAGNRNGTTSIRKEYHFQVPPEQFTQLRTGRKRNNFKVETYVFQTGRRWSNGKNHQLVTFDQKD